MKKIVKLLIALTMGISLIIGCFAVTGCKEEDKESSAVGMFDLIREDFAKNKEKEDDEKGREHLEIPADADTIEIENEIWHVVREYDDFKKNFCEFPEVSENEKLNYIFANDIIFNRAKPYYLFKDFEGKLNGNNYKIYVKNENNERYPLFHSISESVVENVIFASCEGEFCSNTSIGLKVHPLISIQAINSIIENCVNYFQPKNPDPNINYTDDGGYRRGSGFVYRAQDSTIENCVNYADFYSADCGIVSWADNCTISNCINYGNLVSWYFSVGGILSNFIETINIEDCINYGNIISNACGTGGIVGGSSRIYCFIDTEDGLTDKCFLENQTVKNCKNYGNIYLLRGKDDKRLERTDHEPNSNGENIIYGFGGIAGSIAKVENCVNEGNFYGFENMGNNIKVDCLGGVVGAAKNVTDCENKGKIEVQKGRAINVGDVYGYFIGSK